EARQRPFLTQRGRQGFVQPLALGPDAADDLGEQRLVGLAINIAVDLPAEAMVDELADHRLGAKLRIELELIKRLHCPEPGDAAPPAALLAMRPARRFASRRAHASPPWNRRFSSISARQA